MALIPVNIDPVVVEEIVIGTIGDQIFPPRPKWFD
jgi:hypothetical protein